MSESVDYDSVRAELIESRRRDPRSTTELISLALDKENEESAEEAKTVLLYKPVRELFENARHLCESQDRSRRELGIYLLGQGGIPERINHDQSLGILLPMLATEHDPEVLSAIGVALGHIGDPKAVGALIRLKNHPDEDVRFGVVIGLLWQPDDRAIATLIELSSDQDPDVRDWATFGLAQREILGKPLDTPAIRAALWARVADEDDTTRWEAMRGLAVRGDPRIVEPLLSELAQMKDDVDKIIYDATVAEGKHLGDPRLYPELLRLRAFAGEYEGPNDLAEAISRCQAKTP